MTSLSPSGRMIAIARNHMMEYLQSHPKPLSTSDLLNRLMAQGEQMGLPFSSVSLGDLPPNHMSRREAYGCVLWSLRAAGLLLTENSTYKQVWFEFVPRSERGKWMG